MQEEKDMSAKEFFYMALWCIILVIIASFSTASLGGAIPYPYGAPFGSAYTPPLYQVNPSNCNNLLYFANPVTNVTGNYSNHFLGQWNLFVHFGACPVDNLPSTCTATGGNTPQCGTYYTSCLSTFKNRDQEPNVIPNSKTWSQTYDHTPYTWKDLDAGNKLMGYKSNFVDGARVWDATTNLVIAASTFMWVGVGLFFLGPFFKFRPYIFRVTPHVLFFFGFLFWIIVLGATANTSQVDPDAWKAFFFQTCEVEIVKGPVFWYGVAVISFTGAFFISEVLFLYFVGYYPDSIEENNAQSYTSSIALIGKKRAPERVI